MRIWKAPNRPNNQISQTFNDGIVGIYSVKDQALPGRKPQPIFTVKASLRYAEQRLGINRAYLARQNQVEVERVIRIPHTDNVSPQDVAITEDGKQYRIDLVQRADGVYPPSDDLTLTKIIQKHEVKNALV